MKRQSKHFFIQTALCFAMAGVNSHATTEEFDRDVATATGKLQSIIDSAYRDGKSPDLQKAWNEAAKYLSEKNQDVKAGLQSIAKKMKDYDTLNCEAQFSDGPTPQASSAPSDATFGGEPSLLSTNINKEGDGTSGPNGSDSKDSSLKCEAPDFNGLAMENAVKEFGQTPPPNTTAQSTNKGGETSSPMAGTPKPSSTEQGTAIRPTGEGSREIVGEGFPGNELQIAVNGFTSAPRIQLESDESVARRAQSMPAEVTVQVGHGGAVTAARPEYHPGEVAPVSYAMSGGAAPVSTQVLRSALDERISRREITTEQAQAVMEKVQPMLERGMDLETALTSAQQGIPRDRQIASSDAPAVSETKAERSLLSLPANTVAPAASNAVSDAALPAKQNGQPELPLSKVAAAKTDGLVSGSEGPALSAIEAANTLFNDKENAKAAAPGDLVSNSGFKKALNSVIASVTQPFKKLLGLGSVAGSALKGVADTGAAEGDLELALLPAEEAGVELAGITEGGTQEASGVALGLVFFGLTFASTLGGVSFWRRRRGLPRA